MLPISPLLNALLEEGPQLQSSEPNALDPNGVYRLLAHELTECHLNWISSTLKDLPSSPIVDSHIRKFGLYLELYDAYRRLVDLLEHDKSSARSTEEARGITNCASDPSTVVAYQRWIRALFEECSAIQRLDRD